MRDNLGKEPFLTLEINNFKSNLGVEIENTQNMGKSSQTRMVLGDILVKEPSPILESKFVKTERKKGGGIPWSKNLRTQKGIGKGGWTPNLYGKGENLNNCYINVILTALNTSKSIKWKLKTESIGNTEDSDYEGFIEMVWELVEDNKEKENIKSTDEIKKVMNEKKWSTGGNLYGANDKGDPLDFWLDLVKAFHLAADGVEICDILSNFDEAECTVECISHGALLWEFLCEDKMKETKMRTFTPILNQLLSKNH